MRGPQEKYHAQPRPKGVQQLSILVNQNKKHELEKVIHYE
jgi:hypothetical protein